MSPQVWQSGKVPTSSGCTGLKEKILKKCIQLPVGLFSRRMPWSVGHGHAVGLAEEFVDGDRVIESQPAGRRVFRAARDEERAGRDQGVQLVQVAAAIDHLLVGAGARIILRWESRFRSGM